MKKFKPLFNDKNKRDFSIKRSNLKPNGIIIYIFDPASDEIKYILLNKNFLLKILFS